MIQTKLSSILPQVTKLRKGRNGSFNKLNHINYYYPISYYINLHIYYVRTLSVHIDCTSTSTGHNTGTVKMICKCYQHFLVSYKICSCQTADTTPTQITSATVWVYELMQHMSTVCNTRKYWQHLQILFYNAEVFVSHRFYTVDQTHIS